MECNIAEDKGSLKVQMKGKLTFADSQYFQQIIKRLPDEHIRSLDIKIEELTYVDSSGIGLLLMLKDKCDEAQVSLTLCNPQGQVRKLVELARLDQVLPFI